MPHHKIDHFGENSRLKRYHMGAGRCDWCGQHRTRTYDYRGPGALDYRLDRPTRRFCNLDCYRSYHG